MLGQSLMPGAIYLGFITFIRLPTLQHQHPHLCLRLSPDAAPHSVMPDSGSSEVPDSRNGCYNRPHFLILCMASFKAHVPHTAS